ncbi:hypothetical protein HBO08_21625 [Pseudomonas rhodesiae]|uniref:hypothetical protein n=1 Tax=Pseudomonas rhodesiae TaxID=76760 RepID=UPI001474744C|nr:hypothetical protein [Pseudomonas rhodesiae]NMZ19616.1 hypothetical protein [Pseudomonas rhodesiae]
MGAIETRLKLPYLLDGLGLPRGTILKKDLEIQGLFFRLSKSGQSADLLLSASFS